VRARRPKPLAVLITSLFLAAHVLCVCTGPAHAAVSMTASAHAAAHACCRHHDSPASGPAVPRTCLHCSSSAVAAPETAKLTAPLASPLAQFLLPGARGPAALPAPCAAATYRHAAHAPPVASFATVVLRL
jgi:hypothetical protein